MADRGLVLALMLADDDLEALSDYFSDHVDLDSEEADMLNAVYRISQLHKRIIAGQSPIPRYGYMALGAEER